MKRNYFVEFKNVCYFIRHVASLSHSSHDVDLEVFHDLLFTMCLAGFCQSLLGSLPLTEKLLGNIQQYPIRRIRKMITEKKCILYAKLSGVLSRQELRNYFFFL